MRKIVLILCLVPFFAIINCKERTSVCGVEKPLEDLSWLKTEVDKYNLVAQNRHSISISIYQCVYGDNETGFLIDKGGIKPFYNCSGEVLCIMNVDAGETCSELNIVSQKLIWEIKNEGINNTCEFENPLTDLPWLKEYVDEIDENAGAIHVRIYQCTYKDGIGFLIEPCVGCPDAGYGFTNCEGQALCTLWGFTGDPCTEYEIDFENKQLIFEVNN